MTTYDPETGRRLWRFFTVPGNPRVDNDETTRRAATTWRGEWWKFGGGGIVWSAMTYDEEADTVYIGTGNGAPWNHTKSAAKARVTTFTCPRSVYRAVKSDVWVASQSGGTELCSGFVGAVPTLPVYAGEIQTRMLGMDVHVWSDDGRELVDEVGELVVTTPFPSMPHDAFPSMPVRFWNDVDDRRYRETYFEQFPGVWRHGDFIKINTRGGCYVYGRSDSTLNRHGVRIGTAEVYRSVEKVPGVEDSLVVCCERPDGSSFMPLFVRLKSGTEFGPDLTDAIRRQLRSECSPRHVPDCIVVVDAIPYTLTGKKMEIPVRKLLGGCRLNWRSAEARCRTRMRSISTCAIPQIACLGPRPNVPEDAEALAVPQLLTDFA
ncbi:MAG: hypothetical protein IPJ97_13190 [Proteobacteria bacterium]|nr:hypothetical protein [Pseudomonadota bacterium]